MILRINCPKCGGAVWEEDLPDSRTKIDLVCIICGHRKFYDKRKYLEMKKKIEKAFGKSSTVTNRTLSA